MNSEKLDLSVDGVLVLVVYARLGGNMALQIEDPEADSLVRELTKYTGETVTQAVRTALRERIAREKNRNLNLPIVSALDAILQISQECAALPVLDSREPDDIMGYNELGLPS